MSTSKGQHSGPKNSMYGRKHTKATRKKMSRAVLKAYAEGRIKPMQEHCWRLGVTASKKVQATNSELWANKILSYIVWLFDNTFTNEPSFTDSHVSLANALDIEASEPQAKYWTALLQIDFDKVKQNLADDKVAKAFASINHYIAPLCPESAGVCYYNQYGYDKFGSEVVNSIVTDYVTWMIENRNKLENYMIQTYAINGKNKEQFLEILKRRSRSSWGDQKSEKSVTIENKESDNESKTISITFTDA